MKAKAPLSWSGPPIARGLTGLGAVTAIVLWLLFALQAQAQEAIVTITDPGNDPRTLTVATGTQVTWTNRGSERHTATSDDGIWDSGRIAVGASFSWTFNQPGRFRYHCTIHPRIRGEVVVEGAIIAPPVSTATPAPPSASPARPTPASAPLAAPVASPPPTPTPTPIPLLLLHLAQASYAPQPFAKLQEPAPPAAEALLRLLPGGSRSARQLVAGPLVLVVPRGAAPGLMNFFLSPVQGPPVGPPQGYRYADATLYQVASADGSTLTFARPIELRWAYDGQALRVNEERRLALAAWDTNPGRWRLLPSSVDVREQRVRANVDRLTVFALVVQGD